MSPLAYHFQWPIHTLFCFSPFPLREERLVAANVRYVFERCEAEGDSTESSSRVQDLEPKAITVGKDNMAYIIFQVSKAKTGV